MLPSPLSPSKPATSRTSKHVVIPSPQASPSGDGMKSPKSRTTRSSSTSTTTTLPIIVSPSNRISTAPSLQSSPSIIDLQLSTSHTLSHLQSTSHRHTRTFHLFPSTLSTTSIEPKSPQHKQQQHTTRTHRKHMTSQSTLEYHPIIPHVIRPSPFDASISRPSPVISTWIHQFHQEHDGYMHDVDRMLHALHHIRHMTRHDGIPNITRTAMTCDLMDRVAAHTGRFEYGMRTVVQQLFMCIYESYQPDLFDPAKQDDEEIKSRQRSLIPYFSHVARLQHEYIQLLSTIQDWKAKQREMHRQTQRRDQVIAVVAGRWQRSLLIHVFERWHTNIRHRARQRKALNYFIDLLHTRQRSPSIQMRIWITHTLLLRHRTYVAKLKFEQEREEKLKQECAEAKEIHDAEREKMIQCREKHSGLVDQRNALTQQLTEMETKLRHITGGALIRVTTSSVALIQDTLHTLTMELAGWRKRRVQDVARLFWTNQGNGPKPRYASLAVGTPEWYTARCTELIHVEHMLDDMSNADILLQWMNTHLSIAQWQSEKGKGNKKSNTEWDPTSPSPSTAISSETLSRRADNFTTCLQDSELLVRLFIQILPILPNNRSLSPISASIIDRSLLVHIDMETRARLLIKMISKISSSLASLLTPRSLVHSLQPDMHACLITRLLLDRCALPMTGPYHEYSDLQNQATRRALHTDDVSIPQEYDVYHQDNYGPLFYLSIHIHRLHTELSHRSHVSLDTAYIIRDQIHDVIQHTRRVIQDVEQRERVWKKLHSRLQCYAIELLTARSRGIPIPMLDHKRIRDIRTYTRFLTSQGQPHTRYMDMCDDTIHTIVSPGEIETETHTPDEPKSSHDPLAHLTQELHIVQSLIVHHFDELRSIFKAYAQMEADGQNASAAETLSVHEFWTFVRDCKLMNRTSFPASRVEHIFDQVARSKTMNHSFSTLQIPSGSSTGNSTPRDGSRPTTNTIKSSPLSPRDKKTPRGKEEKDKNDKDKDKENELDIDLGQFIELIVRIAHVRIPSLSERQHILSELRRHQSTTRHLTVDPLSLDDDTPLTHTLAALYPHALTSQSRMGLALRVYGLLRNHIIANASRISSDAFRIQYKNVQVSKLFRKHGPVLRRVFYEYATLHSVKFRKQSNKMEDIWSNTIDYSEFIQLLKDSRLLDQKFLNEAHVYSIFANVQQESHVGKDGIQDQKVNDVFKSRLLRPKGRKGRKKRLMMRLTSNEPDDDTEDVTEGDEAETAGGSEEEEEGLADEAEETRAGDGKLHITISDAAPSSISSLLPGSTPDSGSDTELIYPEFLEALAAIACFRIPDPYRSCASRLQYFLEQDFLPWVTSTLRSQPETKKQCEMETENEPQAEASQD